MITAAALRTLPNLPAAFAQACRRHPDRVAIRDHGQSVTYRQLARRVEEIAAGLAAALDTTSPPTVIAVHLTPGTDAVCGLLAVLATGSAYLPLDVNAPSRYLAQLVHDARPAAVITQQRPVPQLGATPLDIGELAARGRGRRAPVLGSAAAPTDPAYMIFTSGSTGRAKGVLLPHTAMLHSTAARLDAYGVPGKVPLLHSPAVDVYSGVLFWTLLTGATLVIGPGGLRDVPATAALLNDESITDLVYLSSLYPALLDYLALTPPASLRRVMIGSERWSDAVVDRHRDQLPQVCLHNEYGPSESAVWTSGACVWDAATQRQAPVTIGRPVAGTGYQLLNSDRQPIGYGERGELYITGAQLALGYRGGDAAAAEAFLTLPGGERAYRTGDLAEMSPEGDFVFAGRADRQITVQGSRVEPGHVEAVLMRHPSVQLAHVVARADTVLAAYLTMRTGGPRPDADEVRAFVAGQLPASMVPTLWTVLDTLPRSPAGKVDEAALPAPHVPGREDRGTPVDALEKDLAALAGEILNCPPPAVTTRLTDAGASSLALMRLAARIARHHKVIVPFSVLFAVPTIREIAAHVRAALPTDRPPLTPMPHDPAGSPLSWQQQQIWILGHLAPTSLAYHTQCSLELTGDLDVAALEQALSHVVARHEILRSTVHSRGGDVVQVVHEPWPVLLECVDLSAMPQQARDNALRRHVSEQTSAVFDTSRLPLVRWHLYRLAEQQWTLLQVEHHFVHDGWSANLLLAEIRDAYSAYAGNRTPQDRPLPVQYRDWALWQRAWKNSNDYAMQRAYWRRQLEGVPAHGVTFAPDLPRPAVQSYNGACLRAELPADTLDALDEVCAAQKVTRFGLLLTAFTLLVRLHTGETDIVIGSALANRRQDEAEALLGMFVNALPLRLRLAACTTVADTARHVMDVLLEAQDHQEFPLLEILNDLQLPRDPAQNPLFQLMFAAHDTPRPRFDTAGIRGRLHIEHNGSAKNNLNVIVVPNPPADGSHRTHDGANILWEYSRDLFTPDSARNLLDSYGRILTALADPLLWDLPATAFDVLDPAGHLHVTRSSRGPAPALRHPTLHAGVDAQIAATPDDVALIQGVRQITYQELDQAAAALEAELAALDVTPGSHVVLACGPGPEHVAGCLAVLRRGAAYICLDPAEPAARLRRLLDDARPAALICSRRTADLPTLTGAGLPLVIADTDTCPPVARPPRRPVPGEALAYLVYTSGSTGLPKAVMASHTNAVTALEARTVRDGAGPARTLITLPLPFDVAQSMIFFTLWSGGTVVFPDQEDPRDPAAVRDLIERRQVTHVNFVASYYRHFLAAVPDTWPNTLRTVAVGGEPCPPALVAEHAARLPSACLDNEYGPTEATVWCAAARVHDPSGTPHTGPVGIGRPLPGYAIHVVDEQLRPRPAGARGELCVAGPGVAVGYLRRPELTRQHFVTPAAGPLAGVRLLRTGDWGRLKADGTLEVTGRLDEQVKIRGFRVELGEVRQALQSHPEVTAVHVRADHDTDPAGRLTAWVAAPNAGSGLPRQLHDRAARNLPSFMVPADIVVLEELPTTTRGKVDPSLLPRPRSDAAPTAVHHRAAHHPAGSAIATVWKAVLGRTHIDADDTWFALGGDSLQAIRAVAGLRENGISINVSQFLAAATVRQQEALIARSEKLTAPGPERVRRPGGTLVPLTPLQAWFTEQDFADPHHFNQGRLFAIPAHLSLTALEAALALVADSHDAFRTRFTREPGGWSARLDDTAPPISMTEHIVESSADGPDPRLLDRLHQHLRLDDGPLWAYALFTDARGTRRWLAFVAHHLIIDAVSWDILARDLAHAITQPDQPLPPAPGITTAPSAPTGDEAAHWRRLAGADKPVLAASPTRRAPCGSLTHHHSSLSAHATAHLLNLAQRGRATPTALLLAALHRSLQPVTQGAGLYVLIEGHGRSELTDADQVVGWLTSMHPVLLTNGDEPEHLLATAARFDRQLADVPRAGMGYAVARYLHPHSDLGEILAADTPPEITFNYLGQAATNTGQGEAVRLLPGPAGQAIASANVLPTALHVTAAVHGPQLHLTLTADPGRFAAGVIDAVIDRMSDELERTAGLQPLTDSPATAARPHFLIHPVDGQVHWYEPLATQLRDDSWECYGLPADTDTSDCDLPAVAARYVDRIRRIQPDGPYTLTGWSFGAAVAYEMACRLESQGHRVQRLLLLDPPPLPTPPGPQALATQLAALLPDREEDQRDHAVQAAAAAPPAEQMTLLAQHLGLTADADAFVLGRLAVLLRHHQMLAGWEPRGRVGDLHLVQPTATAFHHLDGWLAHGRSARRTVVPGDHHSMLRGEAAVQIASLCRDDAGRTV